MADRRFEKPETTEAFRAIMQPLAPLPWTVATEADCIGVLRDADGTAVVTVDVNGDMPDAIVVAIAAWIQCAVNTCGGFALDGKPMQPRPAQVEP